MEFSRVGQHTIKCVITEQEIIDLGFSLDEIMGNGERTQAFMNCIFDLAEKEFETKFDMGIKTVRADFLPDHTLSLTFSEHPGSNEMMEHLKDIVNGLLNSIPSQKWEEIKAAKEKAKIAKEEVAKEPQSEENLVMFQFVSMDIVIRFAKQIALQTIPFNCLYKYQGKYYLMMDLSDPDKENMPRLSSLTDEYANDIWVGRERLSFLEEHADIIIREEAVETLRRI